jgi:outer membrane protein TolC
VSNLTLDEAIAAALANDPAYRSAAANAGSARLDAAISRSALLPNANGHGEYLYTQPNGVRNQAGQVGSQAAPRFIANNAVREYAAQVMVNETLSVAGVADYRRARPGGAVDSRSGERAPGSGGSRGRSLFRISLRRGQSRSGETR